MLSRNLGLKIFMTASITVACAHAAAVLDIPGFTTSIFARNDDESIAVSLPFSVKFGAATYGSLFLNNNGNLTFTSPLRTYTPFQLAAQNQPIIAAFWADVDTRSGPGVTTYGVGSVDGHTAFGVDWAEVGYFNQKADKLNTFQEILVDRSDTGAGNFDIEYNYNQIKWETGDLSGGVGGLGGASAVMGYSTDAGFVFEQPGSLRPGSFLVGGSNDLINSWFGPTVVMGRYIFQVRNGTAAIPGDVADTPFQPNGVNPGSGGTTEAAFNNVPSGSWFNPPPGELFQYVASDGSLFTQITVDPTTFLLTFGNTSVTVPEGSSFTFPGGGVSSFTISGGNPGPVNLQFNQATASFAVDATTPETGTWWLFTTGFVTLFLYRKMHSR